MAPIDETPEMQVDYEEDGDGLDDDEAMKQLQAQMEQDAAEIERLKKLTSLDPKALSSASASAGPSSSTAPAVTTGVNGNGSGGGEADSTTAAGAGGAGTGEGSIPTGPKAAGGEDEEAKEDIDARSVYIGNVDYGATPEEIQQHFQACGAINRVTILCDKFTGHPKGYAYVEFAAEELAKNALVLNESSFRGRQIQVTQKRTNQPGFNRGRGRGGGGGRGGYRGGYVPRGGRGGYQPYRARGRGRGRGY